MNRVMRRQAINHCMAVVALIGTPAFSKAVPIVIQNAGFENPHVDEVLGLTLQGTQIDYWTTPDTFGGGLWDINNYPYDVWLEAAPEGTQVIYVGAFRGPNYYEQTLSHVIQPNSTYTLTGFVGNPIGYQMTYGVEFRVGNNILASHTGTGLEGAFEEFEAKFDSTGSEFAGASLTIRLFSDGTQTIFDDLKLDGPASAVVAGDYDGNQIVDGADFMWWQRVNGLTVDVTGSGADGNGDGNVDGLDLAVWGDHFGASATVVAVPEPCALAMNVAAGLSLIRRLRDTKSPGARLANRR
jgi:hypothetical protein